LVKDRPTVQSPFAESILALALGEELSWQRHPDNHNGRHHPSSSPRVRHLWLPVKKYPRRKEHLRREHYLFGEYIGSAHDEVFKKTSHFRVQTFSLLHIHLYNVHVKNWRHFVFVCHI
jgi:hypothetical protein